MNHPDRWTELGRFVVPELLPARARFESHDAIVADPLAGRVARLDDVWRQFARLNIPYQLPQWVPGGQQLLRDPELVLADGGTCIDLVLTFAAMCLAANLRPYLVVDPASEAGKGHALVGVDLLAGPEAEAGSVWPDSAEARNRSWTLTREELGTTVRTGAVMLLDCTNATRDLGLGMQQRGVQGRKDAERLARPFLLHQSLGEVSGWTSGNLAVVDVAAVQRAFHPYSQLDRSRRAAITGHLPEAPTWLAYPSRERLAGEIAAALWGPPKPDMAGSAGGDTEVHISDQAWTILAGPAGTGKSRLAHKVATDFEGGAAWWLTANDDRTLRRSLAAAQASESGRTIKGTDMAGRDEETDAGLARLRSSAEPWLVILDNANCKPSELRSRPRPRADRRQRVLVTTLPEYEPYWRELMPGAQFIAVKALTDADLNAVDSDLAPAARDAAAGSALLVGAYTALSRVCGARLDEQLAATTGDGADRLWRVFLCLASGEEADAAHMIAWLPPDGMPASIVGPLADRLAQLGLLTQSLARSSAERLYDLHREIGRAARATAPDPVGHVLTLLKNQESYSHLDRFGDTGTLDEMARVLLPAHRESLPAPDLGPALVYLAQLFELYGRVVARKELPSAEELHIAASSRDDVQGLLLADCFHGRARAVNQDTSRNEPTGRVSGETEEEYARRNREREVVVDDALTLIERARTLRQGHPKLVARSDAVLGLLLQKKAKFRSEQERATLLITAYDILARSRDERQTIIREERRKAGVSEDRLDLDPEIARARFNMAGVANSIARALPRTDPEGRARYLEEARRTYDEVLRLRQDIYGTFRPHPHIVACIRGLGLIAYQSAWLIDGDASSRLAFLRAAHHHLSQALIADELLDPEDGTDVIKTLFLLAKVSERRLRLSAGERRLLALRSEADKENT